MARIQNQELMNIHATTLQISGKHASENVDDCAVCIGAPCAPSGNLQLPQQRKAGFMISL